MKYIKQKPHEKPSSKTISVNWYPPPSGLMNDVEYDRNVILVIW